MKDCAKEFGDTFTITLKGTGQHVIFSHPDTVRQVLTCTDGRLDAGEGNAVWLGFMGSGSLLLLDGERHRRERHLLGPPFQPAHIKHHCALIREGACEVSEKWRVGDSFSLLTAFLEISLEVILRAVFGLERGKRHDEIRSAIRSLLDALALGVPAPPNKGEPVGELHPWPRFQRRKDELDRLLYEEIRERRAVPDAAQPDMLTHMIAARYPDGGAMHDQALRDELVSLLMAGHETTATSLAWAVYWSARHPDVAERIRTEGDGAYVDAVCRETLNVLTAILAYSELILADLEEDHPMRADVTEILLAGRRAASLTGQLLAFSRRQVLEPQVVSLNSAISALEGMLRRLIGEDVQLTTSIEQKVDPVLIDPTQLDQVILNLTVNARDAMPNGGSLTIASDVLEFDADVDLGHEKLRAGRYVVLSVSDNGTGMSPETQARIFEPFFTTKESGKGTGLGLATVYGIVQQSEGHISVESTLGKGTTFRIFLPPASEAARSGRAAAGEGGAMAGSETVLLVEDEESVRKIASSVLKRNGYRVLEAPDGLHAWRIVARYDGPIDLMLTDVIMPGINGPKLADRMARMRPEMKVMYMTGYANEDLLSRGVMEDGISVLSKPFTPMTLTTRVREVLDRAS